MQLPFDLLVVWAVNDLLSNEAFVWSLCQIAKTAHLVFFIGVESGVKQIVAFLCLADEDVLISVYNLFLFDDWGRVVVVSILWPTIVVIV